MSRRSGFTTTIVGLAIVSMVVYKYHATHQEQRTVVPTHKGVNLLSLVDTSKDIVAGRDARCENGVLLTSEQHFGRILVPYLPPLEYELSLIAERVNGSGSLNIGLGTGETQIVVVIDGGEGGRVSGLDLIDGRAFDQNETTVSGKVLEDSAANTINCSVRRSEIAVHVNNRSVVTWNGDFSRASLYPHWEVPHKHALFIGSYGTVWRISKMTLMEVHGIGKALR